MSEATFQSKKLGKNNYFTKGADVIFQKVPASSVSISFVIDLN